MASLEQNSLRKQLPQPVSPGQEAVTYKQEGFLSDRLCGLRVGDNGADMLLRFREIDRVLFGDCSTVDRNREIAVGMEDGSPRKPQKGNFSQAHVTRNVNIVQHLPGQGRVVDWTVNTVNNVYVPRDVSLAEIALLRLPRGTILHANSDFAIFGRRYCNRRTVPCLSP